MRNSVRPVQSVPSLLASCRSLDLAIPSPSITGVEVGFWVGHGAFVLSERGRMEDPGRATEVDSVSPLPRGGNVEPAWHSDGVRREPATNASSTSHLLQQPAFSGWLRADVQRLAGRQDSSLEPFYFGSVAISAAGHRRKHRGSDTIHDGAK